ACSAHLSSPRASIILPHLGRPANLGRCQGIDAHSLQVLSAGSHNISLGYGPRGEAMERDGVIFVGGSEKVQQFMRVDCRGRAERTSHIAAQDRILWVAKDELDAAVKAEVSGHGERPARFARVKKYYPTLRVH